MYQKYVHQSLHTEMLKYALLVPKVKAYVSKLPVVKTAPRALSYLQPFRVRWLRSWTKYSDNLGSKLLKHNALILKIHNRDSSFNEAFLYTLFSEKWMAAFVVISPQHYFMLETSKF